MRRDVALIVAIGALAAINFVAGFIFGRDTAPELISQPVEVVDKYESGDGEYYIETWLEVTPEEYIGLDIGDEWEITE